MTRLGSAAPCLLALALGGVIAGPVAAEGQSAPERSWGASPATPDSLLLSTAGTIAAGGAEIARVWPGFWSEDHAFVLAVPHESVLLVSAETPGDEYDPLPRDGRVPGLEGRGFVKREASGLHAVDDGTFDLEYETGDVVATAVSLRDTPLETIRLLLHEAFHVHQRDAFRLVSPRHRDDAVFLEPRYNAMAELERRILADALASSDRSRLPELLGAYLSVRARRDSLFPGAGDWERARERSEGSAHYVGLRGAAIAVGGGASLADTVASQLRAPLTVPDSIRIVGQDEPMIFDDPGERIRWAHRGRFYQTGAAAGLLLDELGATWQPALEDGRDFPSLLEDALEAEGPWHPGSYQQIVGGYDAEAVRRRVDALLDAARGGRER